MLEVEQLEVVEVDLEVVESDVGVDIVLEVEQLLEDDEDWRSNTLRLLDVLLILWFLHYRFCF